MRAVSGDLLIVSQGLLEESRAQIGLVRVRLLSVPVTATIMVNGRHRSARELADRPIVQAPGPYEVLVSAEASLLDVARQVLR